tara:strand:- start:3298 stop:3492 length:195 start_codon:yes stop_codon:yes gene_type:complete
LKILITGVDGYIGLCLYETIKKQFEVYSIDKVRLKIKKQKNFFLSNLLNKKELIKSHFIKKKER